MCLTAAEAQAILDDALFSESDLGEGWSLTGTEAAGDDDDDEDDPFGECMESDIDERLEAEEVAESETRMFEKEGDLAPSELEISAGAVADDALFEEFHDAPRGDVFERCLVEAIEGEIAGEGTAGLEIGFGDVGLDDDEVDGPDVTRGQVGSFFYSFGFGQSIGDADLTRWTRLVAGRLAA